MADINVSPTTTTEAINPLVVGGSILMQVGLGLTMPKLTTIGVDGSNNIALGFDQPIDLWTPTTTQPVNAGWRFLPTSNRQNGPTSIVLGIEDVIIGGMVVARITPSDRLLVIEFTDSVVLTPTGQDPASWAIGAVSPGAAPVSVTGLTVDLKRVILATTQFTGTETYALRLPTAEIASVNGDLYNGSASINFIGTGHYPSVLGTRIIDARHIDVIFSEDVKTETATIPANYAFEPPLEVSGVTRLNGSTYRLTVVGFRSSQLYTMTVTGVRDLANNLIVN